MSPRLKPKPGDSPKRPKLSWDTYQRQVLCCLYRFFECSEDQVSAVFSTIFRSHLVHCGFENTDVPYRTLNAQWCWLKHQKRPVWHHVHVATEFRTDAEWKEIIHLVRITAFELGILLTEKRTDTIVVPDEDFDVNDNPCEFLTSVLLTTPARPQDPDSMDASVGASVDDFEEDAKNLSGDVYENAQVSASVEATGAYHGEFHRDISENTFVYSSVGSMPLVECLSPETSRPKFSYSTEVNQYSLVGNIRSPGFGDYTPTPPTAQGLEVHSILYADAQKARDSSQVLEPLIQNSSRVFEPLVTSHGKVCFWCEKEGKVLDDDETPTAEPNISVDEIPPEVHNKWSIDSSVLGDARLDSSDMASANIDSLVLHRPENSIRLPGLCGEGNVPAPPPLLYRWFNIHSQGINMEDLLVAGWFVNTYPNVTSPHEISERQFLDIFRAHVTRVQVPTPFISAFARPLTPVHRALRNQENAKISIIDPRKLPTPVFNAQPLAEITGTTVARWKGYGEYAIWGFIPSEALICTFDITTLEDIASRDLEIRDFLQPSLIQMQETCHRRLRRDLRMNIRSSSYEDNHSMLERLARRLGVPKQHHEHFAMDIHQAWTMDLGGTCRDWGGPSDCDSASSLGPTEPSEVQFVHQESHFSPGPVEPSDIHSMRQGTQRVRCGDTESTISYVPPESDDGSCSQSTSEEEDSKSQSPDAPCPRHDTPSPEISVPSDTDSIPANLHHGEYHGDYHLQANDIEMAEVAILPTPTSTSRYFSRSSNINPQTPALSFGTLSLSTPLNDDHYFS